jgi:hypothetical protein
MLTKGEPMVALAEISNALGGTDELVRTLAVRGGYTVATDWRGDEALTATDARALYAAVSAEREQHAVNWAAYDAWLGDRVERRTQAGEAAFAKVVESNKQRDYRGMAGSADHPFITGNYRVLPSGETRAAARAARQEALDKFDKREPEVDFYAWKSKQR